MRQPSQTRRLRPTGRRVPVVLRGGMGNRERRAAEEALRVPEPEERLVLSTGRFLGEGFDDSRLDTLFLVSPISWKGTLVQYVGRLHREHQGKGEVRVYDYMDANVPVLVRMAAKDGLATRRSAMRLNRGSSGRIRREVESKMSSNQ